VQLEHSENIELAAWADVHSVHRYPEWGSASKKCVWYVPRIAA